MVEARYVRAARLAVLAVGAVVAMVGVRSVEGTQPFSPGWVLQDEGVWRSTKPMGRVLIIRNEHGQTAVRLEEIFSGEEIEAHIGDTTAGPHWGDYNLRYFVEIEGRLHYVLRMGWGRRIAFDLTSPEPHPIDPPEEAVLGVERERVLGLLRKAVEEYEAAGNLDGCLCDQLLPAIHTAGQEGMTDAVDALRALEQIDHVSSVSMRFRFERLREGDIDPHMYSTNELRRAVQVALRRLGRRPSRLPVTRFSYAGDREPYVPKVHVRPRVDRVAEVREGMGVEQTLDKLGPPDDVNHEGWIYHIDAEEPFTLIIVWDEEGPVVQRQRRIEPPMWVDHAEPYF